MDLHHQPMIRNEEQKNLKLHARDGKDDDTSYPPEKCGKNKNDLDLPEEKTAVEDYQINKLFDFERYTSEPVHVYKDLIILCNKEIISCERALDEASKFFKIKFEEDLEQKQPSPVSSYVIETVRGTQENIRRALDMAIELLPSFEEDVENYLKYRDGPLLALQVIENQYFKKIDELVEIPNVENLIKCLLCNVKDDKELERRSGLTRKDINVIIFLLRRKNIFIPYEKDNTMDEEQYGESEMEDLLTKHKDNIKELSSVQCNYETAKGNVNEYVGKYSHEIHKRLWYTEAYLKSADSWVRIMRQQLEVLQQKDVILNGCESNFDDDWFEACRPRWNL